MKFKVLAGKHSEKFDSGKKDKDGNPILVVRIFKTGEIVDSKYDLAARFNAGPGAMKFEPVSNKSLKAKTFDDAPAAPVATVPLGDYPATEPTDTLDDMTVVELRAHAHAEEIELHGATRKEDLLAAIRAATP